MEIKSLVNQARLYFSDKTSIALFDAYVKRFRNNQSLLDMEYNPLLAQLTSNLKEDYCDAKKLSKPRKFFMFGGGGIAAKFCNPLPI